MDLSPQPTSTPPEAAPLLPSVSRRSFLRVISALFAEAATGGAGTAKALETLATQTPAWITTYITIAPVAQEMRGPLLAAHKAIEAVERAEDPFDLAMRVAGAIRWAKSCDLGWNLPDTSELSSIRGVFTEEDKVLGILSDKRSSRLRQLYAHPDYQKLAEPEAKKLMGDSRLTTPEARLRAVLHRMTTSVHSLSQYGPDVADKLPEILTGSRKFADSLGWRYLEIFSDETRREEILADPVRDALGDLYTGLRSVFGDSLAGDFDCVKVSEFAQRLTQQALEQLDRLGVEVPDPVRAKARIINETTVVQRSSSEQLIEDLFRHRASIPLEVLQMLAAADSLVWNGHEAHGTVSVQCNAVLGNFSVRYSLDDARRREQWKFGVRKPFRKKGANHDHA